MSLWIRGSICGCRMGSFTHCLREVSWLVSGFTPRHSPLGLFHSVRKTLSTISKLRMCFHGKGCWVWKQKPQIQIQCFIYLLNKHPPRAYFVLGTELQPSALINSLDFIARVLQSRSLSVFTATERGRMGKRGTFEPHSRQPWGWCSQTTALLDK